MVWNSVGETRPEAAGRVQNNITEWVGGSGGARLCITFSFFLWALVLFGLFAFAFSLSVSFLFLFCIIFFGGLEIRYYHAKSNPHIFSNV